MASYYEVEKWAIDHEYADDDWVDDGKGNASRTMLSGLDCKWYLAEAKVEHKDKYSSVYSSITIREVTHVYPGSEATLEVVRVLSPDELD